MSEKILVASEKNGIARLKMKDEQGKNTFTTDFIGELIKGLEQTFHMTPKVLIIQGLPDIFCGGADKKDLMDLCEGKLSVKDFIIQEALLNLPFPVIAAMEGHAIGGGLAMATCCDIVLAARESRYGAVFMQMGFTPGMGSTTLLPLLVGPYIASEMVFTGKRFKGSELSQKSTNINYILPKEKIMPKAEDLAMQISEKNIKSISMLKNALCTKKKKLLIEARLQEDLMHRISFGFPETRAAIDEFYLEHDKRVK